MARANSQASRATTARWLQRLSLQELMVDFFGSLVPGVIFLAASLLLIGTALAYYFDKLDRQFFAKTFPQTIAPFEIEVLIAFLMTAYVFGFLFFRQDPKDPDRRSFRHIRDTMQRGLKPYKRAIRLLDERELAPHWTWAELLLHLRNRTARKLFALADRLKSRLRLARVTSVTVEELERELSIRDDLQYWVVDDELQCEFPYPKLRTYLQRRRLDHLSSLVAWGDTDDSGRRSPYRRSKNYINIIKIRLAYYYPEHSAQIVRNEAHVRLMSSSWYMSRSLFNLSAIVLLFNTARLVYQQIFEPRTLVSPLTSDFHFLLIPFCVSLLALWLQRSVEKFLHYQRVREVIFVLETAFTAFRERPERIRDVCPDFEDYLSR